MFCVMQERDEESSRVEQELMQLDSQVMIVTLIFIVCLFGLMMNKPMLIQITTLWLKVALSDDLKAKVI